MNYSQSLHYLDSFLDLEKLSQFPKNTFFNLKRMEHLLKISGHPEKRFFPILIAGTTGKGSTGFFLESILRTNGFRVGYYHSPHVEDPRERIRLQGGMAPQKLWGEGLSEIQRLLRTKPLPKNLGQLTYFEILTFLAILIFAKTNRQIGIFEIGLGGRLDATNILKAPLVLLTPIHLDHEAFLGSTVAKIAGEKAAIVKRASHVVIGKQFPEAFRVVRAAVRKNQGCLWKTRPVSKVPLGLAGDFQKSNAGMAMKAAEILRKYFHFPVFLELSRKGLQLGNWKGRMEYFRKYAREFIIDGAHNPISMKELAKSLRRSFHRENWLIFGAMQDKNSRKMLEILSRYFSNVILTQVRNSRAKTPGMLAEEAKGLFNYTVPTQNTREALKLAAELSKPGARIVVTGSFYLVGEARRILKVGPRSTHHGPRGTWAGERGTGV